MSTKEALQSLQSRLAERLQANHGDDARAGHWLGVKEGGHGFLLPLTQSGEIYPWSDPHPVSYTKDWFLGVANLRGALCGVVSLTSYLSLPPSDTPVDVGIAPGISPVQARLRCGRRNSTVTCRRT